MSELNKRRTFLKVGFLSSTVVIMSGCDLFGVVTLKETIALVQNDLFPKAAELNINTADYINTVLHHKRISDEDKKFLKNGIKWLNETSVEMYKDTYAKLSQMQRQDVLKSISQTQWGDSWIYNMMTYIFEAMLGDPIYGGNNREAGWKWLEFSGGQPRPKKVYI